MVLTVSSVLYFCVQQSLKKSDAGNFQGAAVNMSFCVYVDLMHPHI